MKKEITHELIDELAKIVNLKIDKNDYEIIKQRLIKFNNKFKMFDKYNDPKFDDVSITLKSFNTLRKDEPEENNSNEVLKNAAHLIDNFVEIK